MAVFDSNLPKPNEQLKPTHWFRKVWGYLALTIVMTLWSGFCGFNVGYMTCYIDNMHVVKWMFRTCENATVAAVTNFVIRQFLVKQP